MRVLCSLVVVSKRLLFCLCSYAYTLAAKCKPVTSHRQNTYGQSGIQLSDCPFLRHHIYVGEFAMRVVQLFSAVDNKGRENLVKVQCPDPKRAERILKVVYFDRPDLRFIYLKQRLEV